MPEADRNDFGFDINKVGERNEQLEAALNEVLSGKNNSWVFSEETKDMLNGASIMDLGITIVDFKNFSHLISTGTATAGQMYQELNRAVFSIPEVTVVYYQFDGSASDWYYWQQAYPVPVTRAQWKKISENDS